MRDILTHACDKERFATLKRLFRVCRRWFCILVATPELWAEVPSWAIASLVARAWARELELRWADAQWSRVTFRRALMTCRVLQGAPPRPSAFESRHLPPRPPLDRQRLHVRVLTVDGPTSLLPALFNDIVAPNSETYSCDNKLSRLTALQ